MSALPIATVPLIEVAAVVPELPDELDEPELEPSLPPPPHAASTAVAAIHSVSRAIPEESFFFMLLFQLKWRVSTETRMSICHAASGIRISVTVHA
ncbi:hypothetical protein [Burkholderia sp. Ac-20353]|uniref:hypothetical protein n=1 Tax=Burkholderia sp. Ac-20353 TaxID=2703894 RepID=UPI001F1205A8|nr:hypothetical protein [Burkholderia sp. Ac-20353]MBN3790564.1 hypothetical protein [Burkholderia sp. Ac-20353]